MTALQRMPPRQAATLVLRDVVGYPVDEVADIMYPVPADASPQPALGSYVVG